MFHQPICCVLFWISASWNHGCEANSIFVRHSSECQLHGHEFSFCFNLLLLTNYPYKTKQMARYSSCSTVSIDVHCLFQICAEMYCLPLMCLHWNNGPYSTLFLIALCLHCLAWNLSLFCEKILPGWTVYELMHFEVWNLFSAMDCAIFGVIMVSTVCWSFTMSYICIVQSRVIGLFFDVNWWLLCKELVVYYASDLWKRSVVSCYWHC